MEAWPSGLWHLSTKQKGWKQPRGFESHRFLQTISYLNIYLMNIFPVIHYLSDEQTLHNVDLAQKYGCKGVFLIDMNGTGFEPVTFTSNKAKSPFVHVGDVS